MADTSTAHPAPIVQQLSAVPLLQTFVACTTVLVSYFIMKRVLNNQAVRRSNIPSVGYGLPGVGRMFDILQDVEAFSARFSSAGKIFHTGFVGQNCAVIKDVKLAKEALNQSKRYVVAAWPASVARLFGPNSLASKGGHDLHRKQLLTALGPKQKEFLFPLIELTIRNEINSLYERRDGFDIHTQLNTLALKVALGVLFKHGTLTTADITELCELFEPYSDGFLAVPLNLPWTVYGKALKAREKITSILLRVIRSRKGHETSGDGLALLMAQTQDEEVIRDLLLNIMIATRDTSASMLTTALEMMDKLDETVLKDIREEVSKAKHQGPLSNPDCLDRLPLCHGFIWETLRCRQPLYYTMRDVVTDISLDGGKYTLPRGWKVMIMMADALKHSTNFESPEKFDVYRYEKGGERTADVFCFGGGSFLCAGSHIAVWEGILYIAYLLENYTVTFDKKLEFCYYPNPVRQIKPERPVRATLHKIRP